MWQFLLARLFEPSTIATTVQHPTVQAVSATVAGLSGIGAMLVPDGNSVKKYVSAAQGVAQAVADNSTGNHVNVGGVVAAAVPAAAPLLNLKQ